MDIKIKSIAFVILGLFLLVFANFSAAKTFLVLFIVYILTGGWNFIWIIIWTAKRDIQGLLFLLQIKPMMQRYQRNGDNVVSIFRQVIKRHPNKTAIIMVDQKKWTFKEVEEESNAVGNFFDDLGYRKGDTVAIFMESCPEFVFMWLGLSKIGTCSALINSNLRMEALAHCLKISNARSVVFGAEMASAIMEARHLLPGSVSYFCRGAMSAEGMDGLNAMSIDASLQKASRMPPPVRSNTLFNECLFNVYTSGTTGLPKAAIVTHSRYFYMSHSIFYFFRMRGSDVIYDTLPLYHTAGGILGVGSCLLKGCTLVLRKKFSASRFWDDCIKYDCTVAQYIGEICRYLLLQPPRPTDSSHKVRLVFGNGLRPQIWSEFKSRFNLQQIGELYGATEGNANIINSDNTPGAIGFQTRILPFVYPITLLRVDEVTGSLIRGSDGLCIRCQPGEPGELVGKVVKGDPMREFDGYTSDEATKKKLAHDVFKRGDCYFLTGDILEMDNFGYMYFRDRTGDTFRWKGENVSTSEVEAIISNLVHLNDACVYGVEIPGSEGKAGMAVIVDEFNVLDVHQLYAIFSKSLPVYARPVFIRIVKKLDMTGTFKLRKNDYKSEGFDPDRCGDPLFYLDQQSASYKPLNSQIYGDILAAKIRF